MLDVRLVNANIITMDPAALPAKRVVDLQAATVLPGFIDAHVHLACSGLRARSVSVAPCLRIEDVLAVVGQASQSGPPGTWLDIVGYDQRTLGRHLTAAELDAVSAGRKVLVMHDSGHACVVNSPVLEPLPADVLHGCGVLTEQNAAAVRQLRAPYSTDELVAALSISRWTRWSWRSRSGHVRWPGIASSMPASFARISSRGWPGWVRWQ